MTTRPVHQEQAYDLRARIERQITSMRRVRNQYSRAPKCEPDITKYLLLYYEPKNPRQFDNRTPEQRFRMAQRLDSDAFQTLQIEYAAFLSRLSQLSADEKKAHELWVGAWDDLGSSGFARLVYALHQKYTPGLTYTLTDFLATDNPLHLISTKLDELRKAHGLHTKMHVARENR